MRTTKSKSRWLVGGVLVAVCAALAVTIGASGAASSAKKQLRIGYIATAPVTSGDWEPANYRAFQKMVKKIGAKASVQASVAYDAAEPVLRRLAQSNDVVILDSSGFADTALKVAPDYPKTWIVIVSYLASTKGLKNVAAEAINWNQLGYAMGTIAGYASPNHKFGQVNSVPIPAFTLWAGGSQQAAEDLFSKSDYQQVWINTFTDPSKGKQGANALLDKGANVLFASADTAGDGVLAAVKERNKLMVMPYIDQFSKGPTNIITNVLVNWDRAYDQIGTLAASGKLQAKIYDLNFQNGGLSVTTPFRNVSASVQTNVMKVISDIKSGKIKVQAGRQLRP